MVPVGQGGIAADVPWSRPTRFAAAADLAKPQVADATCGGVGSRQGKVTTAHLRERLDQPLHQIPRHPQVKHLQRHRAHQSKYHSEQCMKRQSSIFTRPVREKRMSNKTGHTRSVRTCNASNPTILYNK